ncbi:hypothetical protein JOB18_022216 [Solea senegalensis]|uniref:Uncharacterized protein n=1 Tax=Solea senegalensis TaxID=28829 RepID=A0AAV6QU44_SOLSE|nr:hypothetical protein JOB18_022216 [Solea senegalensis]
MKEKGVERELGAPLHPHLLNPHVKSQDETHNCSFNFAKCDSGSFADFSHVRPHPFERLKSNPTKIQTRGATSNSSRCRSDGHRQHTDRQAD